MAKSKTNHRASLLNEQLLHVKLARQWLQGFDAGRKRDANGFPMSLAPEEYLRLVEVFLQEELNRCATSGDTP